MTDNDDNVSNNTNKNVSVGQDFKVDTQPDTTYFVINWPAMNAGNTRHLGQHTNTGKHAGTLTHIHTHTHKHTRARLKLVYYLDNKTEIIAIVTTLETPQSNPLFCCI